MDENLIISGTKKDVQLIWNKLIEKYGKDATLDQVIKKEIEKYGENGGKFC